jgi:hypothetical protein
MSIHPSGRLRIHSDAFLAIMMTGACVLPDVIVGIIDASAVLSPSSGTVRRNRPEPGKADL